MFCSGSRTGCDEEVVGLVKHRMSSDLVSIELRNQVDELHQSFGAEPSKEIDGINASDESTHQRSNFIRLQLWWR